MTSGTPFQRQPSCPKLPRSSPPRSTSSSPPKPRSRSSVSLPGSPLCVNAPPCTYHSARTMSHSAIHVCLPHTTLNHEKLLGTATRPTAPRITLRKDHISFSETSVHLLTRHASAIFRGSMARFFPCHLRHCFVHETLDALMAVARTQRSAHSSR